MIPLSARLETLLAQLAPCRMLVDIGTDHALIPIAAVERGIAARAVAADLRVAPLLRARRNIAAAAVSERVFLLRANGLSALAQGSVDAVIMAGMSGELMVQLCDAAAELLSGVSQLLLQPNSDASAVRAWALRRGLHLKDERMLRERGQFFVTCAFQQGAGVDPAYDLPGWTHAELCLVGPLLLARRDSTALRFFEWQCARLGALVEQHVHALQPELDVWHAARAFVLTA